MDFNGFKKVVEEIKLTRSILFETNSEEKLNDDIIANFLNEYSVRLPDSYILFAKEFGTGYFVFTNVYSINPESEWNLISFIQMDQENKIFIAISDNGCGDFYGYLVDNQVCLEDIFFYDHELKTIEKTAYQNIYEYLTEIGLRKSLGNVEKC